MPSKWLTGTLVVVLAGTGYFGYRQYQERQALLVKSENQYQRAFHSLASDVDLLQDELGKALAVNTERMMSPSLANTWRISYAAQSDLSQLPLTGLNMNKTQDFLQNVSQFSYELSLHPKPANKQSLSEADWKTLHDLYQQSFDIEKDLRSVQAKVLDQNLRFIDTEYSLRKRYQKADNQIVDGFKAMEKRVSQYPEVHSQTYDTMKSRNNVDLSAVSGTNKNPTEVQKIVADFLNRSNLNEIQVQKNGAGARYPSYTVTVANPNGILSYLGVMQKGGHIIWMTHNRPVNDERLDLEQAQQKAQAWANAHGFAGMTVIRTDQYDKTAVYQFACQKGDVTFYPCTMTVKVALDDGSVLGFNAQDYVVHHREHQTQTVKLTKQQALAKVNPHLQVQDTGVAQILDDNGKPVTVWEVTGTLDNNTYRVYINADTGVEEKVEKLKQEGLDVSEDQNIQDGQVEQKPPAK